MQQSGQKYTLAENLAATGDEVAVRGGEYAIGVTGDNLNGNVALQILLGTVWANVVSVGAGQTGHTTTVPFFQTGIRLPAGRYRLQITGTASGINAYLYGLV